MERIFLSMIVSGVLLAVTSTGLLVFSRSDALTVAVANLPAAALREEQLMSRQSDQDRPGRRERTRF